MKKDGKKEGKKKRRGCRELFVLGSIFPWLCSCSKQKSISHSYIANLFYITWALPGPSRASGHSPNITLELLQVALAVVLDVLRSFSSLLMLREYFS